MVKRTDYRPNNNRPNTITDKDRKIIKQNAKDMKDKKNLKDSQIFSSQTNTPHTTTKNNIYVSEDRKSRDKSYIHNYKGIAISKDNTRKGNHYYAVCNHKVLYGSSVELVQKRIDKNNPEKENERESDITKRNESLVKQEQQRKEQISLKAKPNNHYIIARKLKDENGVEKYYTYYPSKEHGKSPYMYKTKAQANKVFAKGKFPSDQSNAKVVRSEDVTYLDRY